MDEPEGGPPESLAEVERRHIARTLAWTRGNRRDAARLLGIARSTLLAKIRRYGLDEVREGSSADPGGR
jgi:DNA-binding NtrC family response regulator